MQAAVATMTPELVMVTPTTMSAETTNLASRIDVRRLTKIAFLVVGIAATAFILGQYEALMVYGLPAPFLRRVPVRATA